MPTVQTVLQKLGMSTRRVSTGTDKDYVFVYRSAIADEQVARISISILKASELTSRRGAVGDCLFVIKDQAYDPDKIVREDADVVEFPGDTDAEQLMADVSDIITSSTAHAHHRMRLVDVLLSGGGVNELLSEAAEILGNPIFLADVSSKILSSALPQRSKGDLDYAITNSIERGYTPYEDLWTWKFSSLMQTVMSSNGPVVLNYPSEASPRRMFYRVKNRYLYAVLTEIAQEYGRFDEELLVFFSKLVNSVLEKAPASTGPWAGLFMDLINGSVRDKETCEDRAAACKLHLKKHKYLAMIRMREPRTEGAESDQTSLATIRLNIENLWPQYKAFSYRGDILALIDSADEQAIPGFTEALRDFLFRNDCVASISSCFDDLLGLETGYQQAKLAMATGAELESTSPVVTFDDLYFHSLLRSVRQSHPLTTFCTPGITKLMKHDSASNSHLLTTLGAYLECGRNIREVSNTLNLHRNTVSHRLQKISEIIDEDLDSFIDCYKLFLSLKMVDLSRE